MAFGGVDPFPEGDLDTALTSSVLASLPTQLRAAALADAIRSELPKGRFLPGPPLGLVVSGLIRVAVLDAQGHRFAVSYLRLGDIAGLARLTGRRYPLEFQTVTDCRLLRLHEARFEELRRRHAEVGVAVADQLNRHLDATLHETAMAAFGHVRQRVVRHLLARAVVAPGKPMTCPVTHQELADAVGAARETVTRTLGELKSEGLLEGDHRSLVIPDPERLHQEHTA